MNDQNLETNKTPVATNATPESIVPAAPVTPPANILKQFVRAIDRALADDPKRTGWALTCYALLRSQGGQRLVINPADVAKLAEWQRQHDKAMKVADKHGADAAKAAWVAHIEKMGAAIQADELGNHTPKTLEDWEAEFEQKQLAAQAEMNRIYLECQPACEVFTQRLLDLVGKHVDNLESGERRKHSDYGVEYSGPSNLIKHFRKAMEIAKNRVALNQYGNSSPREMVPWLTF
jgi:hypothetical protein